ncbi:MAG: methionine--tRNA ligase [Bdellovibrionales bacterium]
MSSKAPVIVTSALPYANNSLHLGHMVEYLQTDFWVRYQKSKGEDCIYICGDDTHGTPIMISARDQGITPEKLVANCLDEHLKDFADFGVEFDHYSSTNSPENKELVSEIYLSLKEKGHITTKMIKQLYCEHDKMFLPDRFVKGTCPSCKSEDQYGDSCDHCGATYGTSEVIEPKCSICSNTPVLKDSDHVFVKLSNFQSFLKEWVPGHTSKEVSNKLKEWFEGELRDWDISRDDPYFGFQIPGYDNKYFYVWVDAPVGYIAATKEWCEKNNKNFDDYWKNPDAKIYHFIGKDIIYFHSLFWPSMLSATDYTLPSGVFVHGFLKVNGEKMSKSKGTFIKARKYLENIDPLYLRYYYACKLNSGLDDIDLNLEDFVQRVNSDLIGKITNLGSRGGQMLGKKLDGLMGELDDEAKKVVEFSKAKSEVISKHYQNRDFARAMEEIRSIADEANRYFDEKQPWKSIKEDVERAKTVLTCILNVFRDMAIYLSPVIPEYSKKVSALFNEEVYDWSDLDKTLENHQIAKYEHLATRLDLEEVKKILS